MTWLELPVCKEETKYSFLLWFATDKYACHGVHRSTVSSYCRAKLYRITQDYLQLVTENNPYGI